MAGQLVKRGKNVWLVRVYLGRAGDGKRKWHNHTVHGRKEDAQAYLTAYLRDRDLGRAAPASRITVDELLDRYLKVAAGHLAVRTWQGYQENYRRYVRPELGHMRLDRLTTWEVQGFYDRLKEKLAPRTINTVHISLSAALAQGIQWRLLPDNPASGTVRPSFSRQGRKGTVLEPSAARMFLEALPRYRWGVLLELLLFSGARPEEALGLTWPAVDWRQCQVRITRVLQWLRGTAAERALLEAARPDLKGEAWSLEPPKTKNSVRAIALPPRLMERLREHRRRQMEEQARAGSTYAKHGLVFCNPEGRPIRPWLASVTLKRVLRKLGLPDMCLYDLRKSCTTLLLSEGEHVKVIAERLGQAGVTLTQDVYTELLPTMQRQASNRLDSLLYGPDGPEEDQERRKA